VPSTSTLALHIAMPTEECFAAKGVLRYLAGTAVLSITHRKQVECVEMVEYGDADYAGLDEYQAQHNRQYRCFAWWSRDLGQHLQLRNSIVSQRVKQVAVLYHFGI